MIMLRISLMFTKFVSVVISSGVILTLLYTSPAYPFFWFSNRTIDAVQYPSIQSRFMPQDSNLVYGMDIKPSMTLAINQSLARHVPDIKSSCWIENLPGKELTQIVRKLKKSISYLNSITLDKRRFCARQPVAKGLQPRKTKFEQKVKHDRTGSSPSYLYPYHNPFTITASCQKQELLEYLETLLSRTEREELWRIRCMPTVFLAGVTKAGTTDLFLSLTVHPHISMGWVKEQHYFSRGRFPKDSVNNNVNSRSFSQYLDTFDIAANSVLSNGDKQFIVDASVATFYEDYNWAQVPGNKDEREPQYISAMTINQVVPEAKVILMFRNPVKRVLSFYKFKNNASIHNPEDFHRHVKDAVTDYQQCFEKWGVRPCSYNVSLNAAHHKVNLQGSLYSVFLKDWEKVFSKDRLHLIRSEDYYNAKGAVTNEVVKLIGARPLTNQELSLIDDAKVAQASKSTFQPKPETDALLRDFYRPFVKDLTDMTGRQWWADLLDN